MSQSTQPVTGLRNRLTVRPGLFGAFWLTGGQTINRIIRFVVFAYLARTLGVDTYGDYIYAFRLVTVFVGIADFGLELIGIKLQARHPRLHWDIVKRIVGLRLVLATAALVLMVSVTLILPEAHRLQVPILVFGSMMYFNEVSFNWPFFAGGQVKEVGIGNVISGIVTLCATLIFVKNNTDIYPAILSLVGGIAAGVVYMVLRYKNIFWNGREQLTTAEEALLGPVSFTIKEAAPLAASGILFRFYSSAIPVILGIILTTREAGIFDAANLAPQFALVISQMLLNSFILPVASKAYAGIDVTPTGRRTSHAWKTLETRLGVGLVAVFALLLLGVPVVAMVSGSFMRIGFGADFSAGSSVLTILSARALVGSINLGYRSLLLASDSERSYLVTVITQTTLVVLLGTLGINAYGLVGGAYGLMASELLALSGVVFYLHRRRLLPGLRIPRVTGLK